MDTIIHRKRRDNRSLNKDIPLTERRLAILKCLAELRYATTSMLYQYVADECGAGDLIKHKQTLTKMRKDGGLIWCPDAQFETINANYKELVYQLTDRGKRIIKPQTFISSSSFFHDWMTAHCIASLKLVALKEPGVTFIGQEEILSLVPMLENPFKFPVTIEWRGKQETIKNFSPDWSPFGLEYKDTQNFFLWETDCDTEDNSSEDLEGASITKKILAYKQLDKDDAFHNRLKIVNTYVCIVTISETRKRAILETVKRVCGKSPMFLVKVVPHFRRIDYTPQPLHELWYTGWERVGYPPFFLGTSEE